MTICIPYYKLVEIFLLLIPWYEQKKYFDQLKASLKHTEHN